MATPVGDCTGDSCANFWGFLIHIYDKGGITVVALLLLAYVFYKLVWKVWSAAMASKDNEIERLIKERDYYQERLIPDRLTSEPHNERGEKK